MNSHNSYPHKQTIAIVDTGLGGISVHSKLDEIIRAKNLKSHIKLLYFNVRPACGTEYVNMQEEVRIETFDEMLSSIMPYKPDLILIACNTLSVIYSKTTFSLKVKIPVTGIIDLGVNLILDYLDKKPDSNVVILGTDVTIHSQQHLEKLVLSSVNPDRVITQICKDLDVEIQYGNIAAVKDLAFQYLLEAKDKIRVSSKDVALVLCCSHYQFGKEILTKISKAVFQSELTVLNPNDKFSEIIDWESLAVTDDLHIENRVYSHVLLCESEIRTIGSAIKEESPDVYKALKNYYQMESSFRKEEAL